MPSTNQLINSSIIQLINHRQRHQPRHRPRHRPRRPVVPLNTPAHTTQSTTKVAIDGATDTPAAVTEPSKGRGKPQFESVEFKFKFKDFVNLGQQLALTLTFAEAGAKQKAHGSINLRFATRSAVVDDKW